MKGKLVGKLPVVYILASQKGGTLYIGVTSDLGQRMAQHRDETMKGFSQQYQVKRLVYYETYDDMTMAIKREKQLKRWKRNWKIELIEKQNEEWQDMTNRFYKKEYGSAS